MTNISVDLKKCTITSKELTVYSSEIEKLHKKLNEKVSKKGELCGWLNLPSNINKTEIEKINKCAKKIQENSDVFVVIGVGGSYLGSRAVIEALTNSFYNMQDKEERKFPQILYVGNNLSSTYINELKEFIQDKDISINVISKSGTTLEPALSFRFFRNLLETKYGIQEAQKRIYVTTDKSKGALKELADEEGYQTFIIPNNIGGRYSVLTPVGLLPIAVAGINIDKIINGAKFAELKYNDSNLKYNDCYKYAVVRNELYKREKMVEVLACYNPKLHYFIEWWKQLFAESEGKELKGILPIGAEYTTDLHSLGQFIQDGPKMLFETVLWIEKEKSDIKIDLEEDSLDELNYLAGKTVSFVNHKAMLGTIEAHVEDGIPNVIIKMEKLDEEAIGHLIYFFEKSCAISALLLGVNPFNQPGVEKYKKNMLNLLERDKVNGKKSN